MANPFAPGVAQERARAADTAKQTEADYIPVFNEKQQNLLTARLAAAKARQAEVAALTATLDTKSKDINVQSAPAIADLTDANARAARVAKMNPLARMFAQVIRPSLSDDEIERDTVAAARQLQGFDQERTKATEEFRTGVLSKSQLWAAQDDTAEAEAAAQTGTLEALARSSQGLASVFDSGVKSVVGVTNVLQSKVAAADAVVTGLSEAQRSAYLHQMGDKPELDIDGTMVPRGVLEGAVKKDTSVNMGLASQRLGLQSQNLGMAAQGEDYAIAHMSYDALKSAAANGGVYNGHQLDETKVNVALVNRGGAKEAGATEGFGNNSAAGRLASVVTAQGKQGSATIQRYASALGQNPSPQVQSAILAWHRVTEEIGTTRKTQKGQFVGGQESRLTTKSQAAYQGVMDAIEAEVGKGSVSPGVKAITTAFVFGRPVTADTVSTALTEIVTQGLTGDQMRFDRYSSAALNAGKKALQGYLDEVAKANNMGAGQVTMESLQSGKIKYNKEELQRRVTGAVRGAYGAGLGNEFEMSQPTLAKSAGASYGRITQGQHAGALQDAQKKSISLLASTLGVSEEAAKSILKLKDDESNSAWAASAAARETLKKQGAGDMSSPNAAKRWVADNQSQFFMRNIDRYSQPGFTPSKAYSEWLHSPEYEKAGSQILAGQRGSNPGGFAMDALAGSSVASRFTAMRDGYTAAASSHERQLRNLDNDIYGIYQGDNKMRFKATMHNVQGLTPAQSEALITATEQLLPQAAQAGDYDRGLAPQESDWTSAFSVLTSSKFVDPGLEAARRIAVKNLAETQQRTDRSMAAIGNSKN